MYSLFTNTKINEKVIYLAENVDKTCPVFGNP